MGNTKLKPIADLTPTPYLVFDRNGNYWYHTLPQLDNLDYSKRIKDIPTSDPNIKYDLYHCPDNPKSKYFVRNHLIIKKHMNNNKWVFSDFNMSDIELINSHE